MVCPLPPAAAGARATAVDARTALRSRVTEGLSSETSAGQYFSCRNFISAFVSCPLLNGNHHHDRQGPALGVERVSTGQVSPEHEVLAASVVKHPRQVSTTPWSVVCKYADMLGICPQDGMTGPSRRSLLPQLL